MSSRTQSRDLGQETDGEKCDPSTGLEHRLLGDYQRIRTFPIVILSGLSLGGCQVRAPHPLVILSPQAKNLVGRPELRT